MRIYYKIPDSDDKLQNKMMGMLYENLRLRVLLAVQPVKEILDKEEGVLIIERDAAGLEIDFRMEGFSEASQIIIRHCLGTIKLDKAVKG